MTNLLDYSVKIPLNKLPAFAAAAKKAGYDGVVRYIGTPGLNKNMVPGEAAILIKAGLSISLVYEDDAGWMFGGRNAGIAAAKASLADADRCGLGVRCVYFADDEDTVTSSQFAAVAACLDGAAGTSLTKSRTGVYGEADVIDYCVGPHATYGWQTLAWSQKRITNKRHFLQKIGYVYPGGVQCDANEVKPGVTDWGQWPLNGVQKLDAELKAYLETMKAEIIAQVHHDSGQVISGDAAHPDNLKNLGAKLLGRPASGATPAVTGALPTLSNKIEAVFTEVAGIRDGFDPAVLKAAFREALQNGTVNVKVTVDDNTAGSTT